MAPVTSLEVAVFYWVYLVLLSILLRSVTQQYYYLVLIDHVGKPYNLHYY